MGVNDLTEDEDALVNQGDITISELVRRFGKESTRRGLEYMRSLSEADQNFREVSKDEMEEGYERAGIEGDTSPASDKWASSIQENGLGLDEDE